MSLMMVSSILWQVTHGMQGMPPPIALNLHNTIRTSPSDRRDSSPDGIGSRSKLPKSTQSLRPRESPNASPRNYSQQRLSDFAHSKHQVDWKSNSEQIPFQKQPIKAQIKYSRQILEYYQEEKLVAGTVVKTVVILCAMGIVVFTVYIMHFNLVNRVT